MLAETAAPDVLPADSIGVDTLRAAVDAVFADPYIRERVAHDHRAPGFISHPDVRYLAARVHGELAGFFLLIDVSPLEVEIHAALHRWALPWSRDLGRSCLAHVFSDPGVFRATAPVLADLLSARNYCRRLGFKDEGFKRGAFAKRGTLVDCFILGITRPEWEALQ